MTDLESDVCEVDKSTNLDKRSLSIIGEQKHLLTELLKMGGEHGNRDSRLPRSTTRGAFR